MTDLVQRLRGLTMTSSSDYTIGRRTYWQHDDLEAVLDNHRFEVIDDELTPLREVNSGGTAVYTTYQAHYRDLETTSGGTAVLYLRLASGARVGTAEYTVNYQSGQVTFAADTGGSVVYLTGRSYDLNGAAADVWEQKAAQVAERFDFTADGASFKASQMVAQYTTLAQQYRRKARTGGITVGTFIRTDVNVGCA